MGQLVLTVLGADRPGLIRLVSEQVGSVGGNWLESRMARLAGQFAGIALVDVPEAQAGALTRRLQALASDGLDINVRPASVPPASQNRLLRVEAIGHDRPGIVREMTRVLADHGVNIEEFETRVSSASFSAEQMFHAKARLAVPERVSEERLRGALEHLGNEMMVDITMEPPGTND